MSGGLLVFFVGGDRLQVFSFENLPAVQAFKIVDAVTPGNDFSTEMVAHTN